MRSLFLILMLFVTAPVLAQNCPLGSQCVPQATIDKCANIADELIASRDAIAKLKVAASAADARDASAQKLIEGLERLVAIGERIQNEQGKVIDLYKEAMQMFRDVAKTQNEIILALEKRLNAPKSAWNKFLSGAKQVLVLVSGILIGRGL